jgi:hypothetical protein
MSFKFHPQLCTNIQSSAKHLLPQADTLTDPPHPTLATDRPFQVALLVCSILRGQALQIELVLHNASKMFYYDSTVVALVSRILQIVNFDQVTS